MPVEVIAPGSLFAGDFRIIRPLSEGGMGRLFVAEQISTGRARALKLMQPHLVADERMRQRFVQEARISARIESAHIVEVIGTGVDVKTGLPFIAMELLDGEDLAQALVRWRLEAKDVRELLAQLCHALAAAHRAGVVHRDLKPENIFLAKSKRAGVRTMEMRELLRAAEITAARAALAASGALGAACRAIMRTKPSALTVEELGRELLSFWISDTHGKVRAALGTAIVDAAQTSGG